jgi:hypothetical protein
MKMDLERKKLLDYMKEKNTIVLIRSKLDSSRFYGCPLIISQLYPGVIGEIEDFLDETLNYTLEDAHNIISEWIAAEVIGG